MKRKFLDLSIFKVAFLPFLYVMEVKSEQYFNQNKPKIPLKKINLYIYISQFRSHYVVVVLVAKQGEGQMGGNEFTAVIQKPLCHISTSSAVCLFFHVLH